MVVAVSIWLPGRAVDAVESVTKGGKQVAPRGGMVHDDCDSKICGEADTYRGHPRQDFILSFGGNEAAVLHESSPSASAHLSDVSHGVIHSCAKVMIEGCWSGFAFAEGA